MNIKRLSSYVVALIILGSQFSFAAFFDKRGTARSLGMSNSFGAIRNNSYYLDPEIGQDISDEEKSFIYAHNPAGSFLSINPATIAFQRTLEILGQWSNPLVFDNLNSDGSGLYDLDFTAVIPFNYIFSFGGPVLQHGALALSYNQRTYYSSTLSNITPPVPPDSVAELASERKFTLSYSRNINDLLKYFLPGANINIGFNFNLYLLSMGDPSVWTDLSQNAIFTTNNEIGFGIDFGMIYDIAYNFAFGLVVRDLLSPKISTISGGERKAPTPEISLAYTIPKVSVIDDRLQNFTIAGSWEITPGPEQPDGQIAPPYSVFKFGLEAWYNLAEEFGGVIGLRTGLEASQKGGTTFAAGATFNLRISPEQWIVADYAITLPFTFEGTGFGHYISASYQWQLPDYQFIRDPKLRQQRIDELKNKNSNLFADSTEAATDLFDASESTSVDATTAAPK